MHTLHPDKDILLAKHTVQIGEAPIVRRKVHYRPADAAHWHVDFLKLKISCLLP